MCTVYIPIEDPHAVALCECCDKRPGTTMVVACGLEVWVCDECRGEEEVPS